MNFLLKNKEMRDSGTENLVQHSRSQMQNQKETTTKFCRVLVSEANRTRTIWRNQEWCGSLGSPAPYVPFKGPFNSPSLKSARECGSIASGL
jgi:hypothetical protein